MEPRFIQALRLAQLAETGCTFTYIECAMILEQVRQLQERVEKADAELSSLNDILRTQHAITPIEILLKRAFTAEHQVVLLQYRLDEIAEKKERANTSLYTD